MATVWAALVGVWIDKAYATGWSHSIQFHGLADLNRSMQQRGVQGKVTKLGIVAHGNQAGRIVLDRMMTATNLQSFARDLERLRWFLTADAQVCFSSCVAGKASEGSALLSALSRQLPGRTIIGFTLWGETGAPGGTPNDPGDVRERESLLVPAPPKARRLSPEHPAAKWARNGVIVRNSPLERDPQYHCAKPGCPGHRNQRDRCP